MIFNDMLSQLYLKVYISIVVSRAQTVVCVQILKNKHAPEQVTKSFETNVVSEELQAFVKRYCDESAFYYVSFLDYSKEQGVLLDCKEANNPHKISTVQYLCNGSWSTFTNKNALIDMQNRYAAFGIDYIFSPFTVLANFFESKISQKEIALYVLLQKDTVAIMIFCDKELLYGEYVSMDLSLEDNLLEDIGELDLENDVVDLESINLDESIDDLGNLDDLEDFNDLDDLESFGDLDEFEEPQEASHLNASDSEKIEDISGLSEDYKRFIIIQNAIYKFYTDEQYKSTFLETAYVAMFDTIGSELQQYLEEELFLKVHARKIDLCQEISKLAIREEK